MKLDLGWLAHRRLHFLKNPIKMNRVVLTRLAHQGKYPFCQCCGAEVVVGMLVHRRQVTQNGSKSTTYFCDECERSGRMYAVGSRNKD